MANREGSILSASVWMFVLSILLFWLPFVGPLLAGFLGGRRAGGVGNAIVAALLPGFVFGLIMFFLASVLVGLPLIGLVAGVGGGALLAVSHAGPLVLGAIIGALL